MFGFLDIDGYEPGDSDKLGSKGRFSARIDKFRNRNASNKYDWDIYREKADSYPIRYANWESQQFKISKGKEVDKKLRKPRHPKAPMVPTFRLFHPIIEHHFWWLTHNILAHTLIGLVPIKWFFDFHDWTSKKLNAE